MVFWGLPNGQGKLPGLQSLLRVSAVLEGAVETWQGAGSVILL